MIDKITSWSVAGEASSNVQVAADLSYGFKPCRSAWDKEGSNYVNFGITDFVATYEVAADLAAQTFFNNLKPLTEVEVTINGETFTMVVMNNVIVQYPADVEVDVKYPQMKKYVRITFKLK